MLRAACALLVGGIAAATPAAAMQWVMAAQDAGARYIVLVAKHHDGFCLWPTEESDYSVKSSPWKGGKGDLLAEVAAAARKHGAAIKARYGNNLVRGHSRTGSDGLERALDDNPDTFWSAPAGSHHAIVEVRFDHPVTFDRAMTLEWLEGGQRVRQYQIEVWTGNGWKTIARAQAIGHKKIDTFEPITATRVRLNLLSTTDAAQIREFALYDSHSSANDLPSSVKAGAAVR
jgi:alpha-L-fucosidase